MEIYRDEVYDLLVDRESVSYALPHDFRSVGLIGELTWLHSFLSQ